MIRITRTFLAAFILCAVTTYNKTGMASSKPNLPGPNLVWQRLDIPNPPPGRVEFSLALDSTNQRALLFGGYNTTAGDLNDLWSTNGSEWIELQSSLKPIERVGTDIIYDEARQEAILFGGVHESEFFGNTWKYISYDWHQQVPQTSPPPRVGACMAYDAARNQTILFGGAYPIEHDLDSMNDTWAWDGVNWQQLFPSAVPNARFSANMVYDRARQNILLFGGGVGGALLNDTWIWDGMNWIEQHPLHSPPARTAFGMAYDQDRQQVILFGGLATDTPTDTWGWDGQDWTRLETYLKPPVEIAGHAQLVYLPALHTTTLIGDYRLKDCSGVECTFSEETQVWVLTNRYLSYLPMTSK